MRRVGSYGGPSGVAGSERLKHKLSLTPGLHLLSSSSLGEAGFLAVVGDPQDERVIHRTVGAARNFYAIASNLNQVAKRKSWVIRKDPFAPLVKETFVLGEPVDSNKDCNGGAPALLVEEVDGKCFARPGANDNGAGEGAVEAVPELLSNDSQVVEEVSASQDTPPFGLSGYQGGHLVPDVLQEAGPHVETEPLSTAFPEALSTSPTLAVQEAQASRAEKCEAATSDSVDILGNAESQVLGSGGGLQDAHDGRSKDLAAVAIESCWRGWKQRKDFKKVKERVVFLQSLVRRNHEYKQYHSTLQAAIVLQKCRRAVQSIWAVKRIKAERALKEERKINNAAVVVQKHWRSVQSRRLLNYLRRERDIGARKRSDHAAVVVQKHWRGHRGKCLLKRLKMERVAREQQQQRIEGAAVVMQKHCRARRGRYLAKHLKMEQAVKDKHRIDNAAIVLQKHFRAHQARCLMKHLRMEQAAMEKQRTIDAAIVLQKNWRACQGRCFVKHLRLELAVREKERIVSAAIVLQKHWRAQQGRCRVKELKKEQVLREQQTIRDAAVVLQKSWRAQQGRRLLKHLKMEYVAREEQRTDNAAVFVQKHWRAKKGRSFGKHLKLEQVAREQQRSNDAARVIQKHWRAQQGRFLMKQLRMEHVARVNRRVNDAAVVLQKHWRAQQGRSYVKHLKLEQVVRDQQRSNNAAVVVQKHWRDQQARYLVKRLKMEQVAREKQRIESAAIVLQKYWRAQQARYLVKRLRMEQVAREEQRIESAAIVLQKYWRAQQARYLVKRLRMEQVAREKQRIDNAAIVLQKYWRAQLARYLVKRLRMEQVAREKQRIESAAIVLQKYWRAQQARYLVKRLRMEQVAREKQRIESAAIVLQKYWRAQQARYLVKRLRMEQVAREQQRIDNAAIVLQKYWRARLARYLVKRLRMEQVAREKQIIDNAAIVLQKYWRAQQARYLVKRLRMEQVAWEKQRIDNAAVVLQKHWRALSSRSLVKHLKMELSVKELQRMHHAAIVLQKCWRARQSRCLVERMRMEQLLRQRKMDQAAIVLQKHWRGWQSRWVVKDLKMGLAARNESQRVTAATTLQKHWRARQSMLLVKHLKTENTMREQQRVDNAATIFQKLWRGQHSRLLVKHLKSQQALRKLHRIDNAAIVLQKHWRGFQGRQSVKFLYMEQQGGRECAALCIQARVRGNATRVRFKAALTIQKAWQLYWSSRLTVSAVSIQHADLKRKIQAIIILQAHARGFVVRRRLRETSKSAKLSLKPEPCTETGVAAVISPDIRMSGSNLYASDVLRHVCTAEDSLESSPSSSIDHHIDAGVQSVDHITSSPDGWQKLECAPIDSHQRDLNASHGGDSEFSATSVGDVQIQKNGVQEDWNYVAVDQLEECLDTCLAALRPLPSGSQHCLPGVDVPEKSRQFIATDQKSMESEKNVDRVSSPLKLSTSTGDVVQQVLGIWSDLGETGNEPSDLTGSASDTIRMQSYQVKSQATPISARDQLEISSGLLQETDTEQMDNPVQGRNVGRRTLKQNEQRLKQFAQVFLLQRSIALQQQRAQAAPPFPPPISTAGSEVPSHTVTQATQPLEVASVDRGAVALESTSLRACAQPILVDEGRPEEHHVVCEIFDPENEQTSMRHAPARHSSGPKQIIERPGPDVVLDMVLLLRRIKEEYGNSEADFEGESSTWCTSGCGDIEEGVPLLERNFGSMRRESSMAKLANAVSIKHISIPDVNAVLLVFIAMVVYTRTVCKGLFFRARQTHRRP